MKLNVFFFITPFLYPCLQPHCCCSLCLNVDLQSQRTLKASYDAAVAQMDEQLAQLKSERQKNSELAAQLQLSEMANVRAQQVSRSGPGAASRGAECPGQVTFLCHASAAAGAARGAGAREGPAEGEQRQATQQVERLGLLRVRRF